MPLPYSLFFPVKIWGAGLCGWLAPVSPLEVLSGLFFVVELLEMFSLSLQACLRLLLQFQVSRTVSLLLHMNGTYRAHWADRLGFCKHCLGCLNFCLFPVLYGVRHMQFFFLPSNAWSSNLFS